MNMIRLKYIIFHHNVFPPRQTSLLGRTFHCTSSFKWQLLTNQNQFDVRFSTGYLLDCCMCCCLLQTWSHYTYSNMLCQNTFWITLIQICGYFFYRIVRMDFFYKVMRHKKKKKFMISCFLFLSITFTLNNPLQSLIFYLKRAHPCR